MIWIRHGADHLAVAAPWIQPPRLNNVIPAKAGGASQQRSWSSSVFALGVVKNVVCFARVPHWIPAFAGMTNWPRRGQRPRASSSLDAADVFAGTGIDLDHFVLVHEQRHADHGAGLELAGLPPPPEVSPRRPGSVSTIFSSTKFGACTEIGRAVEQGDHALFLALEPLRGVTQRRPCRPGLLERSPWCMKCQNSDAIAVEDTACRYR